MRTLLIWLGAALVYSGFFLWYTGWSAPLAPAEVDGFMAKVENIQQYRDNPEIKARVRAFLEKDDGHEFFMVNLIRMRDKALPIRGASPDETPRQVLDHYAGPFMPEILARAGWLIAGGRATSRDLELWGVQSDTEWPMFAVVRYRSRRDMMEVISKPEFDNIHPFKFAAIEATRAFPISPVVLTVGPKLVVGLIVLVLALAAQLVSGVFARRS